jgi:hypothetical protein
MNNIENNFTSNKPPAIYIVLGMSLGAIGLGCIIIAAIFLFSPDDKFHAVTYGLLGVIFLSIGLVIKSYYNNLKKKIESEQKEANVKEKEYSVIDEKLVVYNKTHESFGILTELEVGTKLIVDFVTNYNRFYKASLKNGQIGFILKTSKLELSVSKPNENKEPDKAESKTNTKGPVSLNIRETDIKNQLSVIRTEYRILENAYVVSNVSSTKTEEIEKVLANIISKGDIGIFFLVERIMEGITFSENNIILNNWGEETWNELIKKQIIIKALASSKAKSALPKLEKMSKANCNYSQWEDCISGPLTRAINLLKED